MMRTYTSKLGSLEHLLAINDVRVRVERGCRDLGWELLKWEHAGDLANRLERFDLEPDAYFQIRRPVAAETRTAGFFLELERASKSRTVLRSKLRKYAELYYGQHYQDIFAIPGLRLLVVYATAVGASPANRRVELAIEDAKKLGVTFTRVTNLEALKAQSPTGTLIRAIWREPRSEGPVALFPTAQGDGT
jgi:hypothetical protein